MSVKIFEKHGIIWGTTQSGKTYRTSQFLAECPHYCFFINTQLETRPEEYSQITVNSNKEVLQAIENGFLKICINYHINWDNPEFYKNELDQLIKVIFSIAQKNPDHFRATVIIDELDNYVSLHKASASIDNLFNRGLRFKINAIGLAHEPINVTPIVRGACHWYIFFEQSDDSIAYWKRKKRELGMLKYGNYEGYYYEKGRIFLFSHNRVEESQQESITDEMHGEIMQGSSKVDNPNSPPQNKDLDSNMHKP